MDRLCSYAVMNWVSKDLRYVDFDPKPCKCRYYMHILTKNLSNARIFWIGTNLIIRRFWGQKTGSSPGWRKVEWKTLWTEMSEWKRSVINHVVWNILGQTTYILAFIRVASFGIALSICTWFLKNQVWKNNFNELDFSPAKINFENDCCNLHRQ